MTGRLIEAEELKELMIETLEHIKENPKMNGQEMHIIAAIQMLSEMIDDAPTVDAIPVEWIEKHLITHDDVVNGNFFEDEALELNMFVHDLIDLWRSEQAKRKEE